MQLYEALAVKGTERRKNNYPLDEYSAIGEILEWAHQPDVPVFRLRAPQLRALETYWYLRLVEKTPHIFDLYTRLFEKTTERLDALGMTHPDMRDLALDIGFNGLIAKVKDDDEFVKKYKLEALRETLTLDYPSYILALAMGAGKTVLIGAIFATEFAMAQEYPDNDFVENALIFAPGKTIIESLRELAEMQYEAVLPPRMYKSFAATLKLTFTRDGDPDIPVTRGISWNVIVTNTEKIRIQKESIRKSGLGPMFGNANEDEAKAEVANLRLQAIASLPKLAIFSDEAEGTLADDVWTDINPENSQSRLLTDYPTQKPEALLDRIIQLTSYTGDIVLDCFIGSGTTAAVAQKLGRRWIGADINKGAIQTTTKRLQGVIQEQAEGAKEQTLPGMDGEDETPPPAQLGFSVYRVNDYDLQIQHNEAFNLAVEHLG